ncbi:MAG: UDP-2,3-diacylglucosamine diphosphatase [Nitrospirae bacterium]|nr:UDP-2,3-diacylglucosamine diphosphatase [Nitrospirota bacterium]
MSAPDPTLPVGIPQGVRAVFLSDAHLRRPEDANYRRMLAFLAQLPGLPDLFILGDFFDFWFGFKAVVPGHYVPLLSALGRLAEGGTRIHFVEGNHDFAVGEYFSRTLGAVVHPDEAEVNLDGHRLYLAHGDLVDQGDRGYQRLRRALRSVPVTWLAHRVPPRSLLAFADRLHRVAGGEVGGGRGLPARFVAFARDKWRAGYDGVLMGHCHVPDLLREQVGGRPCFYANSGDWLGHFTYVAYDGSGFSLRRAA